MEAAAAAASTAAPARRPASLNDGCAGTARARGGVPADCEPERDRGRAKTEHSCKRPCHEPSTGTM